MSNHPEDALDVLLTERATRRRHTAEAPQAGHPLARAQDGADVEPLLTAAARLDVFRDAAPSAAFADDLERRLMARMGQPAQRAPVRSLARVGVARVPAQAAWAGVAAALALTIGLGVFTAQAAPGQPLYPVRQLAQHVASDAFPSSTTAALTALERANADLATYNAEIAQANDSAALVTLHVLRADDAQAARDAAALSDANARSAAQAQVAQFREGAQAALRASLARLDWQGRAQVTDALRSWGDTALVVTQARARADTTSAQNNHANNSNASTLLVLTGAGFTSGTRALVNGQPVGVIISRSATQLTVRIPASDLAATPLVVGVEASDGTVALAPQLLRDDSGSPGHVATPGQGNPGSGHGGGNGAGDKTTPTPETGAAHS